MDWTKQLNLLGLSATAKVWAILGAAALAVALSLFGAGAGFGYAWGNGSGAKELAKEKADRAKDALDAQKALNAANETNRKQESKHAQDVAAILKQYNIETGKENEIDARTVADLRTGDDRLRLPVRTCDSAIASASDAAASRASDQARAELAPETSAALYGLTADGDSAIRERNALIDWVYSLESEGVCKFTESLPPKETRPWTSRN
ncbi:i-spanin [Stenotrophomonas phage Sonora]|nr:i-spanin [Stenotrophomonas phage Sonora]